MVEEASLLHHVQQGVEEPPASTRVLVGQALNGAPDKKTEPVASRVVGPVVAGATARQIVPAEPRVDQAVNGAPDKQIEPVAPHVVGTVQRQIEPVARRVVGRAVVAQVEDEG